MLHGKINKKMKNQQPWEISSDVGKIGSDVHEVKGKMRSTVKTSSNMKLVAK